MARTDPERALWLFLSAGMGPVWEAERIENKLGLGTPDVAYSYRGHTGWIELKCAIKPARASTPIAVPKLTAEQRNFLWKHGEKGHHAWLYLEVRGFEPMLIPSRNIYQVGQMTYQQLCLIDGAKRFSGEYFERVRKTLTTLTSL